MRSDFRFGKMFVKGLAGFILFAIPILLDILPTDVLNLTIGGALVMAKNFIKFNYVK